MLPLKLESLNRILAATLSARRDKSCGYRVRYAEPVSGGDINCAIRLLTDGPEFFLKLNSRRCATMFRAEMAGLQAIAATCTIRTCRPLGCGQYQQFSYLLLEALALEQQGDWALAGTRLAQMHKTAQGACYGFHQPSYCGGSLQPNPWSSNWADFFASHRIGVQLALLRKTSRQNSVVQSVVAAVSRLLANHQPTPALVHGDLWRGNIGFTAGQPVIYDPAIYIGDRETDLAMSELFGRLPPAFYQGYHSTLAIAPGYQQRREIYQLYHLLNHANLFAGSYCDTAEQALARLLTGDN